ncbi:MAG: hypothetical protein ACKVS8_10660 [Phycisphaerales bacterium]
MIARSAYPQQPNLWVGAHEGQSLQSVSIFRGLIYVSTVAYLAAWPLARPARLIAAGGVLSGVLFTANLIWLPVCWSRGAREFAPMPWWLYVLCIAGAAFFAQRIVSRKALAFQQSTPYPK